MRKFNITVDGVMHEVMVEEVGGAPSTASVPNVQTITSGAKSSITAPLQGTVQSIKVNVGDSVKEGDSVMIIEAMKMENDVPATASGVVKKIYVSKGSKVSSGDVLIDIG